MSKVEELLAKYNPNGVQSRFLIDCSSVDYGFPFKSSLFTVDNTYIPIIRIRDIKNGKASTFYKGDYYNEYIVHRGDILVGMDGEFNLEKWNDIDSLLNQRVARINEKPSISLRGYLYHILGPVFKNIENETPSGSVKHLSVKIINSIQIPLPHIKVQEEIVKILDSFTNLIDALNEELSLRQKQFEYYREKIISQNTSKIKTLNELSLNFDKKRIPITEKDRKKGEYPYFGASGIVDYIDDYIFDGKYLLISEDGNNLLARTQPIAFCAEGKFWVNNHAHILLFENDIIRKFVQIYINSIDLSPYITGGAQPKLNQKNLNLIQIPIPENNIESIVSKLDAFESLISSLKEEIALRQKQYEYYREKLLTFE